MEEKELFEEAEKLLEATTLSTSEKNIIIRTAHKKAKRYFYTQYDKWEEYQKKEKIEGKYSDDEVIRRLLNKYVREAIEPNNKGENEER